MTTNKTFKTSTLALSALALAVGALAHGHAAAAATEEQLKNTKLYGDVSIAEDSTGSWGPWSHFEPPAAGPAVPLALPKPMIDPYRPLPQPLPEPVALGCLGGNICGFGVFTQAQFVNGEANVSAHYAALLTGEITQVDEHPWPKAIRVTTTAFDPNVTVRLPDSGEMLRWESIDERTERHQIAYNRNLDQPGVQQFAWMSVDLSGEPLLDTVQAAYVWMSLGDYLVGPDKTGEDQIMSGNGRGGQAVMGRATPLADMAALRADQATATYQGGSYLGNGQFAVQMDVQFGPGTWSGTWNGGRDGMVFQDALPNDQGVRLLGQVGFSASGVIEGVNIRSTAVSTGDAGATVSGIVRGAFFGPNAAAVGGVVDITKTNPGKSVQSILGGTSTGYTNGRYIEPFLAIRGKQLIKQTSN